VTYPNLYQNAGY